MVRLNKIYTRTGDDGTTGLGSGKRRPKYDLRIDAYGTVDEVNATVGLARLETEDFSGINKALARIQNDLFDLGADLATPPTDKDLGYEPIRMKDGQVDFLEAAIDELNKDLQPLKSFVLPGGSRAAAYLHLCRTVSRRAERLMVALSKTDGESVGSAAIRYTNRLSDYFFVAARIVNNNGEADILWVPGKFSS